MNRCLKRLTLLITVIFKEQKSEVPRYRKIFRQPGCLWEILKVFRPILADG